MEIDKKKFKDGDVVQRCPRCEWQTPETQAAVSKCPVCKTSVIPVLRVEKKAAKKAPAKKVEAKSK